MPPKLSVLIVNWRSKEYVRRCLASIRLHAAEFHPQIVVVDSASFDGCGEMLAEDFPEAEFIQCGENVGFGAANNRGFERVTGDALLLLNPDTEIKPGSLQNLLKQLERLPNVGIIGPRLLNTDGSLQKSCVMALPTPWNQALRSEPLMKLFPNLKLWGSGQAFAAHSPVAVEAVSGACMLLPTKLFRRLGGFDPLYFMYGEDMDLCARVRNKGFVVYHIPCAEIVHHGGGSSRQQVSEVSVMSMRISNELFLRINENAWTALIYRVLQVVSSSVRLICVIPELLLLGTSIHAAAVFSVKRSVYVLKWAFGFVPARVLAISQKRKKTNRTASSDSEENQNRSNIIINLHAVGPQIRAMNESENECRLELDFFHALIELIRSQTHLSITVDDGNLSDIEIILPALLRAGLKASFFICSGRLNDRGFLNGAQIQELLANGMTIGSHGVAHRRWRGLQPAELEEEVVTSRKALEDLCGIRIDTAACPFGGYDRRVLRSLRKAGYRKVYTSDHVPAPDHDWVVPRFTITRSMSLDEVQRIIHAEPGSRLSDLRRFAKRLR